MLALPLLLLSSLALVPAHPGHDHAAEALERADSLASMGRRSLSHCAGHLAKRGLVNRNAVRRAATVQALRQALDERKAAASGGGLAERGVVGAERRDAATALNTNHKSNLTGVNAQSSVDTLFGGQNECILGPDTTEGPYYVTGEYVRSNITDGQPGVPLTVDIQLIDTTTCQPLSNTALDFWHCNSTGVYSGVVSQGNGNSADASNINATFHRGIQASDADGVVQFHTTVPGHYTGRATHIHIMAHTAGNWEQLPNNTITGGTRAAHVGQLFFDQDLIALVEATGVYAANKQQLTLNADDMILSQEAAAIDPFLEYVLLGNSVEDGVFAWIAMGVDSSASKNVSAAVNFGEGGGVANANGGMGGPGGGGGRGPGGGGAPPNGTASNTTAASDVAGSSSGALPIWSMSLPLAVMAAALRLARV